MHLFAYEYHRIDEHDNGWHQQYSGVLTMLKEEEEGEWWNGGLHGGD